MSEGTPRDSFEEQRAETRGAGWEARTAPAMCRPLRSQCFCVFASQNAPQFCDFSLLAFESLEGDLRKEVSRLGSGHGDSSSWWETWENQNTIWTSVNNMSLLVHSL